LKPLTFARGKPSNAPPTGAAVPTRASGPIRTPGRSATSVGYLAPVSVTLRLCARGTGGQVAEGVHGMQRWLSGDAVIWIDAGVDLEWAPDDEHQRAPLDLWFSVEVLSADTLEAAIDRVATAVNEVPDAVTVITEGDIFRRPLLPKR